MASIVIRQTTNTPQERQGGWTNLARNLINLFCWLEIVTTNCCIVLGTLLHENKREKKSRCQKKKKSKSNRKRSVNVEWLKKKVLIVGIEPTTVGLLDPRSTNWAKPASNSIELLITFLWLFHSNLSCWCCNHFTGLCTTSPVWQHLLQWFLPDRNTLDKEELAIRKKKIGTTTWVKNQVISKNLFFFGFIAIAKIAIRKKPLYFFSTLTKRWLGQSHVE